MRTINILDCTLRDGGYCNEWEFGHNNAREIVANLVASGVEIVECGFLTNNSEHKSGSTKFNTVEQIKKIIPQPGNGSVFVAMINYGEFDVTSLPRQDGCFIDGIRLAFHKKDREKALKIGNTIKEKGYFLFLQPMVSISYTDEEFLNLITSANELNPYAFYIVDSFGAMKRKDMIRLFYMVEHNLSTEISIGFHSHNNMQLAFSNAQTIIDIRTKHRLIIDSCIYGMGRGAGNLNTELLAEYLNDNIDSKYNIRPLLTVIDEILNSFYQRNNWGFSLPNYLSAAHNTHPNYAGYLNDKHTLTVESMSDIFDMMDDEKRIYYDQEYIEDLYLRYLSRGKVQEGHKTKLIDNFRDKVVLIIAPGRSSTDEQGKICTYAENSEVVTISINFDYSYYDTDYIFISNQRRFKEIGKEKHKKCIVTSNIPADRIYLQTDYKELLNDQEMVQDNAGLMVIRFLMNCGVKKIMLAGIDGYSHELYSNLGEIKLTYLARAAFLDEVNIGMTKVLNKYAEKVQMEFLTKPKFVKIESTFSAHEITMREKEDEKMFKNQSWGGIAGVDG